MDNKLSSIIKRGLKVTTSYIMVLIVFSVFSVTVLGLGKESTPAIMPYLSFVIFWLLFFSVYVEMRTTAYKEKRPQYNLNPSPFKGILYGIIGSIPLILLQAALLAIQVPEGYVAFKRRVFQLVSGPLYWIAKVMGNLELHYIAAVLAIVIIAFLGYFAGHHEFYITIWLKQKLGTKKTKKG